MDEGTDGWKASFPPPRPLLYVMLFERGYEERLRKRVQVVLVGWCIVPYRVAAKTIEDGSAEIYYCNWILC
jgi:hypothetical protein